VTAQEEIPLLTDIETEPSEQEITPESFEFYDDTAPAESVEPLSSPPIPAAAAAGASQVISQTVITYTYDALDRLTAADYSDGSFFHYAYDAAGNRLSETTQAESNAYTYDDANRLTSVNGVAYAWDANGNLLSDGVYSYTYDGANRLTGVTDGASAVSYAYNGLGDRLQTTAAGQTTRYTLDLVSGLTQVLDDGGYTYLYGNGRIAQYGTNGSEYFLADALGSVRQLVNGTGDVTLTQSYTPYGEILSSSGEAETSYAFTGEQLDKYTGLVYLRTRIYRAFPMRWLWIQPILEGAVGFTDISLFIGIRYKILSTKLAALVMFALPLSSKLL
jgi:RHS repeat-associated protein